jgi:hypothetical protein
MNIEKISKYLLWGLMGVSVIVIALFFFIGFSNPYEAIPDMKDPLLLDALMILMIAFIVFAAVCMLTSFILYLKEHGLDRSVIFTWGLPIVGIGAGVLLGLSNSSDTPENHLIINGKDWFVPSDIILTDASMIAIGLLAVIAILAIIWSAVKQYTAK